MMQKLWLCGVLVFLLTIAGSKASAQAAPMQFRLTQWTLAPRAASSGDDYVLWSTAGQPEAGRVSGGNYVLHGGLGGRAGAPPPPRPDDHHIYLPFVTK
jgi:hypothetical protein